MVIERLSTPALFFHDPGTRLGVGQGPVDNPVLEKFVEKIPEPFGETIPASAGSEAADAVEDLPDGDGPMPRPSRAIESRKLPTRGSSRGRIISETTFVSMSQARGAVSNSSSSPENDTGL